MLVDGGDRLSEVIIHGSDSITLVGVVGKGKREIPIDLSKLTKPLTLSTQAATKEDPFVVNYDAADSAFSHPPRLRIDLSSVQGSDAYVRFVGKRWTGSSHNLSQYISIYRGQLSIHVESAKDSDGRFVGQPPHVHIDGDGDFYINGLKQVSLLSPGQYDEPPNDLDWSRFIVLLFLAVAAVLVGVLLCGLTPAAQQPKTGKIHTIDPQPEQQVDPSSQFPTIENEGEPQ
jgi:hypothetical protein